MQLPGRYDLTIPQRADFRQRMRLCTIPTPDAARVPVNATGYELTAQCWDSTRAVMYGAFDVEWIDQAVGLFELVMDHTATAAMTTDCQWDLMVEVAGVRSYWLEGKVTVDRGLSEPLP